MNLTETVKSLRAGKCVKSVGNVYFKMCHGEQIIVLRQDAPCAATINYIITLAEFIDLEKIAEDTAPFEIYNQ